MTPRKNKKNIKIVKITNGEASASRKDVVVTEEPMEIRLVATQERQSIAITMRTPGNDFELAAGFLFAEGVIQNKNDIRALSYCVDKDIDEEQRYNIINVYLNSKTLPDIPSLERHFFTTSACGICGKASLDALELRGLEPLNPIPIKPEVLTSLPDKLRKAQGLFEQTGGLHAAALFNQEGDLLAIREDVGRHNALDKLIGWAVLEDKLPLNDKILLLSGRSSYELVQKSLSAGIPLLCSVSAPSSLAVDLARRFNMTLVGFLRGESFNLYVDAAVLA